MTGATDKDLMIRVRAGDMAAFESLYARYRRPLMGFFLRLTGGDGGFSEDLVQETFVRLWKGRKRYRPTGKFTTYLFQIGKNHWLNERDKKRRRISAVSLEGAGDESGNGFREAVPAGERGPVGETLNHELAARIQEAVDGLSEKLRLVFVLGQVQGMRYADVAEILGIPVGTVKSRMANAEKTIRGRLSGYLGREWQP
jgi:RNA polymerase sigma-70 factor (ECF subfamily)